MKKGTLFCLASLVGCSAVVLTIAASSNVRDGNIFTNKATIPSLFLEHGDIDSLTSSYDDGVFTTYTSQGAEVNWEYKYGKSSTGLIELGKNIVGIADSSNYYIGNTSPITSIAELTVSFTGYSSLYVYGSSNQVDYYLVDTISSNTATTRITGYLYFRLVNAKQDQTATTINSITVSYGCNPDEYNDEQIDITSHSILADSSSVLSRNSTKYYNENRSSQSLKITSNNNQNDWVLSLNHSYTGAEIKKATLSFYINTEDNTKYDDGHNYCRFQIYPGTGTSRNTNKLYYKTSDFSNGVSWTKITFSFNSLTNLGDNETINSLYIRSIYVTTGVYIDQMHLSLGSEDLSPAIINQYESNDLASDSIVVPYGTVTASYEYTNRSSNSVRSSKIIMDNDWRYWYYNGVGMDENMNDKVVSFDILYADIIEGKSAGYGLYAFNYDNYRYMVSITSSSTGVTYSTLSNGWAHVEIDITEVRNAQEDSTDTKAYFGFQVAYARTIYVDNLHIVDK